MKKLLFLALLTCYSFTMQADAYVRDLQSSQPKKKEQKKETQVYVCDSRSAYVYHLSRSCRGLSRCTHGVIKMGVSEAKNNYGRRACKICG